MFDNTRRRGHLDWMTCQQDKRYTGLLILLQRYRQRSLRNRIDHCACIHRAPHQKINQSLYSIPIDHRHARTYPLAVWPTSQLVQMASKPPALKVPGSQFTQI